MKQNVGPGIIIAVVAVILVIVGVLAYRTFLSDPNDTPIKGAKANEEYNKQRQATRQRMGQSLNVPYNGGK